MKEMDIDHVDQAINQVIGYLQLYPSKDRTENEPSPSPGSPDEKQRKPEADINMQIKSARSKVTKLETKLSNARKQLEDLEEKLQGGEEKSMTDDEENNKPSVVSTAVLNKPNLNSRRSSITDKSVKTPLGFSLSRWLVATPNSPRKQILVGGFDAFTAPDGTLTAPSCRRDFCAEAEKCVVSRALKKQIAGADFIGELKKRHPARSPDTLPTPSELHTIVINENEILDDYSNPPQQLFNVKYLQFNPKYHIRPPYFGTWRKQSVIISGTRPLTKDEPQQNYDFDSDEEWENDDNGEDVETSDDAKSIDDDNDELVDGFFVPDDHLSDDERDESDTDKDEMSAKEKQLVKLKIDGVYPKKKNRIAKKLTPKCYGLCWKGSENYEVMSNHFEKFTIWIVKFDHKQAPVGDDAIKVKRKPGRQKIKLTLTPPKEGRPTSPEVKKRKISFVPLVK